ncbi:hypothetical protein AVEN_45522-1 [Araneus ventricosus]|uniref:Uncharacterized protein n=1 Tax=Araneus ventricosus TaxID=182803 RepID=A0A4Y2F5B1_ARAVE|nr:hypothetical protein AVEN_45522-1 [Araneus ventricosus]
MRSLDSKFYHRTQQNVDLSKLQIINDRFVKYISEDPKIKKNHRDWDPENTVATCKELYRSFSVCMGTYAGPTYLKKVIKSSGDQRAENLDTGYPSPAVDSRTEFYCVKLNMQSLP